MHVGPRTGFPHDRSGAADMIRVAVSENQVLDLVWRTAKLADRPEDDSPSITVGQTVNMIGCRNWRPIWLAVRSRRLV